MPSSPGWYPNPYDPNSELFWDGQKWHGSRQRLQHFAAAIPSTPRRPQGSSEFDRLSRYWRKQSQAGQVAIAVGVALVITLLSLLALSTVYTKPWESRLEKECKAMAASSGYTGKEYDVLVDFCVDNGTGNY